MFTHNTIVALMWFVVFASGGTIGGLVTWWRLSYRLGECCDCCTCEDCGGIDYDSVIGGCCVRCQRVNSADPCLGCYCHDDYRERDGVDWPAHERTAVNLATGERTDGWHAGGPMQWGPGGRRTVVLEPGPTIYRALVPLDDESLYGPESHGKPFDSTFIRTVLMDWERRYPIPQDSPNGNMAEAL